jgi:4-carboxymuconolactone decarboxylase
MNLDWQKAESLIQKDSLNKLRSIFSREGLSIDKRALSLVASLQALGDYDNLSSLLRVIIEDNQDFRLVYESLLQGYLFCGYPKAIESVFCFKDVIEDNPKLDPRGIKSKPFDSSDELLSRGNKTAKIVHKDKWEKINNKISDFCPDLGYLMITEGYGHIISRDGLGFEERELAIVSSLTALGAYRQLNSHIRGARNVGCGDNEIFEAIITTGIWVYPDSVKNALDVFVEVTDFEIDNFSKLGLS